MGYLETVAPVALFTLAVLWPPRRPPGLSRAVFVLTHLMNEAPVIGWAWLVIGTAFAVAGGELATVGGAVAAALAVLTAAGLVEVTLRGLRAGRAVESALESGFGGTAMRRLAGGQRLRRVVREVVVPLPWRPRNVRRVRNVRYGPHGKYNLLDLYLSRTQATTPRPVLIHFHGGHFQMGAKSREALPLLHRFAAQGWLCVSANYRLASAGHFPNVLHDAKQVIRWARSVEAARYGADPATVIVAGSSAGAHLAAMAALTMNDPAYDNHPDQLDAGDTSVRAAVCLYGYYGEISSDATLPSTPWAHVRRDAPPFLIVHGANDALVPPVAATGFAERLAETSAQPVVYVTLPAALHSFDLFRSPRFDAVLDGIDAFTGAALGVRDLT